jgi:histidyl-tRNA synthetase
MVTNPLRILDCKVPSDVEVAAGAPSIIDSLSEGSRAHFAAVCAALDSLGVQFKLDPRLVRGLDYYTGTVFEVRGRGPELGAQNALCGGGRYDKLVEQLGGPPCPAVGFAFGVERVVACTPGEPASYQKAPDLTLVAMGAKARQFCLGLAQGLRAGGARVDIDHRDVSVKAQFKRADRLGARFTGVVGDDELAAGKVMLKDMKTGEQRQVSLEELAATLEKSHA